MGSNILRMVTSVYIPPYSHPHPLTLHTLHPLIPTHSPPTPHPLISSHSHPSTYLSSPTHLHPLFPHPSQSHTLHSLTPSIPHPLTSTHSFPTLHSLTPSIPHPLTLVFPRERNICPRRMREQAVSLLRSPLLDVTSVSRR